jgi:hypothetical protein
MLMQKTDKCYIDLLNDGVIVCNLALVDQDIQEIEGLQTLQVTSLLDEIFVATPSLG